jgi:uncharacterized phage protein gp47/JayE
VPAGLTEDGLSTKTTGEILSEVEDNQRAEISAGLNQSSSSALGVLNGIYAGQLGEAWDALRAVYSSFYPRSSSGQSLDKVCSITGTERNAATKSTVIATVNVEDGFLAAPGEMVAQVTGDPSRRFVNTEEVENTSGVPADFEVEFEAEKAGAVPCLAAQLEVIAEPLSGWNTITNAEDADIGDEIDTDAELRRRREQELAGGSTAADAVRTDILQNDALGVTFCRVLENDDDDTNGDGIPGKSIEVIARGPESPSDEDNDALCTQILRSKAGGIKAYGSASRTVLDEQGNEHNIGFTRPTLILLYLEIDVVKDPITYPEDGDDQVAQALVLVGDENYQPGDDAIAERLKAAAFTVTGVVDVTELRLGIAPSPVGTTNVAIGPRELAELDTSRVTVASVNV